MLDPAHMAEIERVLNGAPVSRDAVVTQSWRRCVERYGLDPSRPSPAHIVTESRLREHREASERLIAIARSGLAALFRQIAGQNYVLLLADAQGVTVDFFGDPRFEEDLRRAGLYLGSDWSEDLAGTCGVGSCIVTGEALTIHQTDHFDSTHTPLSCTAAPIFDTRGALTAVLDISLLRAPQPKISQSLALNLVKASARRVEMANLMAQGRADWVLRFSTMPEFLDVDPEAAITLDGGGRITGMTHEAARLLGRQGLPVIGTRLDELVDLPLDSLPDFMRDRPTEDRVLHLRDGQALFGHAIAPQGARPTTRPLSDLPAGMQHLAGPDPRMRRLLCEAARLAPERIPLLIEGETGTGKMRLARAIHTAGRAGSPLVERACATLPLDRPEAAAMALAQAACRGTVVLRNPADLTPEGQMRLLVLIDALDPQGPEAPRLIVTSGPDLGALVQAGGFRRDLYFRLAGAILPLPPLRLRHDFDWLAERMLRFATHARAGRFRLSPAARAELAGRPYPGNLRELDSLLRRAAAHCEGEVIDLPDLPPPALPDASGPGTAPPGDGDLAEVLAACGGNMAQAARRLGVNRSTVLRRARRAGLIAP